MACRQLLHRFWGTAQKNVTLKWKQVVSFPIINYSSCPTGMKVTICGAAGRTGQPLALLLKQCPLLDEIALYDVCPTSGIGLELSHVDTDCKVSSFSGKHMLCEALKDSSVVVILARDQQDSFERNAPVLTEIALQICNTCPETFTIVATEPVESLVPLVSEIKRLRSVYNPRKLLGCVELNCIRANTVLADFLRVPPESVRVPVIGGANPNTMVPVLSAAVHPCTMSKEQVECVTSSIMSGQAAITQINGSECATACLSGAYAVARNVINVVKGLQGRKDIIQCAYVDTLGACAPNCQFFANDIMLGASGVEKSLGIPELTKFESCLLFNCLPYVRNEIERAFNLVYEMCQQCRLSPTPHPNNCYTTSEETCRLPTNWTCNPCPDSCTNEYLATICREMTCKCGSTDLCWRSKESDYDARRAETFTHRVPALGLPSCPYEGPCSVRIEKSLRSKKNEGCCEDHTV